MAITNCWECDKSISDNADKCPECGAGQNGEPKTKTERIIEAVVIIAIPIFFMSLFISCLVVASRSITSG